MANQWEGLRNLEAPGPDYFIPEVFTLAGGEVQGMETSSTDPKVRFDSGGVYITNPTGGKEVSLDTSGVRLLGSKLTVDGPIASRVVRWVREANGSLIAQIGGGKTEAGGDPSFLSAFAFSDANRHIAELVLQAYENTPASTGVYAKTDTQVAKVIAETGASSFMLAPNGFKWQVGMFFATVAGAGAWTTTQIPAFGTTVPGGNAGNFALYSIAEATGATVTGSHALSGGVFVASGGVHTALLLDHNLPAGFSFSVYGLKVSFTT